ncbi:hypothetical protein PHABIO_56 [Pseudomonas phage Phabio]|uniref:Uncharacterized protein n=1 Tax=Pseudomonas phage Phabio TaxID=2006668 RepID=A0A1Y0T1H2_9CAUD|nr:hypothetical protein MZD05_gp056 [Pseudomonas phage Phabio]ARV76687.1 hypothetical protein PHABIO_56 [Pseudomonas phage Phabio]
MSKRNIAIALFNPNCVINSSWPRFTGFKNVGNPVIESGLFGLVDKGTRMHAFFKDTTFQDVVTNELRFLTRGIDVTGTPLSTQFNPDNTGTVLMVKPPEPDTSFKWLKPYTYVQEDGVEWDVYVLITGKDLFVKGTFNRVFKTYGYWDMDIWRPSDEDVKSDIFRIEQCTINHVVSLGHPAMTSLTIFKDSPDYDKYREVDVTRDIPDYA